MSAKERLISLALLAIGLIGAICIVGMQPKQRLTLVSVYCKKTHKFIVRNCILHDEYQEPTGRIFLCHEGGETVLNGAGDYLIIRWLGEIR